MAMNADVSIVSNQCRALRRVVMQATKETIVI